ncbi:hypothetical protein [Antrihabitans stalactiti]|uniref:Uncharacterized protein n=1 Tax=Antrihabitans stalactiti TaxID=2584121 RepID=A0A848KKA6_9NOCA|nr:hypothetical protein [Antrihabitans stalactiti]NMN98298.1 hypothetical protein [Antrihabitans stalactiti]
MTITPTAVPEPMLAAMRNLARTHREHEKYYGRAPLRSAADVQEMSVALKALADQWLGATATQNPVQVAFAGADDLNAPGLVAGTGILFMESEGKPAEIRRLERDLEAIATDNEQTGAWLSAAMEKSWLAAGALTGYPELADLLGERHRIVVNDWQSAHLLQLVSRLLRRALDVLRLVDFTPAALRADLSGERYSALYLYSAAELLDRAADLIAESALLVHDNERRWRVFLHRVDALAQSTASDPSSSR